MTKKMWLRIAFYAIGLAALCALLWFAGPLLSFGGFDPLGSSGGRLLLMGLASISVVGALVYDVQSRMRYAGQIANTLGLAGDSGDSSSGSKGDPKKPQDDTDTLRERMDDALKTLKKSSGGSSAYLYDLPWYLMIGPPGSGKTTALVNSGLKFPLARGGASPAAVAGTGGTRYCDWWFTEDAVLIDTAGRYTTQDSDQQSDRASWLSFLDLLRKNRPKQPINGVFVCISIEDLLRMQPQEVRAHADAIRARLIELHDQLKVDFPVYALFSKADLISGFMEFFGHLNEANRRVVWGATFQTRDKTANMVNSIPDEFELLIERLNQDLIDRIQEEPTPTARVQLFGFPSQVASLKETIFNFLNLIFEPTRYHSNATLRGFYFISGTQQGTPIDQLIGALAKSFGTQDRGVSQLSGTGKSFFITDLLEKVVFKESGWVSTNLNAVRRSFILKSIAYSLLGLVTLGACAAWWISYNKNSDLILGTVRGIGDFRKNLGNSGLRDETIITEADFARILQPLEQLKALPTGYKERDVKPELNATYGLNQRPKLSVSTLSAYELGLNRLMRPRMMYHLEQEMREQIAQPFFLTELLRVYFMVAGRDPMDRNLVADWWRQAWIKKYPGAAYANVRQVLGEHLDRLLEIDPPTDGPTAIEIDHSLVAEAQRAIGRMTIAERAFEILRSEARSRSDQDWTPATPRIGGADAPRVFEGTGGSGLDTIRVPFFYTYAGFHEAFLPKIAPIADKIRSERALLGDVGQQPAITAQYENLPVALMERYTKEFIAAWQGELSKLNVKFLATDKPQYLGLKAVAAPSSPFVRLVEAVAEETALTKERKPASGAPASGARPPGALLVLPRGEVPGARIESAFRDYQLLLEGQGGRRYVDDLTKSFSDVHDALVILNDPTRMAEGRVRFQESLKSLQATAVRFPEPFKSLIQKSAASFDSDATATNVGRILQSVSDQITPACNAAIAGKYPFVRTSTQDIPIQEFQRVFGPNGLLDRFYTVNLATYTDTSGPRWTGLKSNAVGRQLPDSMLQNFQQAAQIREAFFPSGAPGFSLAAQNISMSQAIETARLEVNTVTLTTEAPKPIAPPSTGLFGFGASPPPPPPPQGPQIVTFQWPGPVGLAAATLTFLPESPGRTSMLRRPGHWGLFRLFDGARVTQSGDALIANISIAGREARYQFNVTTLPNPLTLPALRNFRCPVAR